MTIFNTNNPFDRLDLSLLKHFFAVASFGGFSRASRSTGLSQPALSLGLKRLERALNVSLIERSTAPFALTEAGIKLLSFCQEVEGGLDTLMSGLGQSGGKVKPRFRVGAAYSIGHSPLAQLCMAAGDTKDPFELEITIQSSFQLLANLNSGLIDAAIVSDEVNDERVKLTKLAEDKVTLVAGKANVRTFNKLPWTEAVRQTPLVTYPRDTAMRHLVDRICVKERLRFHTSVATNGVDSLKSLVAQGMGVGFVLASLVESEIGQGSLFVPENIPITLPRRGVMLAVRPGDKNGELSRRIQGTWKKYEQPRGMEL